MRISEILTQQDLQTLISSLEDFRVSRSQSQEKGLAQPMNEAICSLSLLEPEAGCCAKVTASGSYSEALNILGEYVEICSAEEMNEEPDEGMSMM